MAFVKVSTDDLAKLKANHQKCTRHYTEAVSENLKLKTQLAEAKALAKYIADNSGGCSYCTESLTVEEWKAQKEKI